MANKTDEHALHKFGTDPQHLIPPPTRNAVYTSIFWNRSCFGVSVADVVHLAVELRYIGGMDTTTRRPSPFLCLLQKLLQLSPELPEITVFLRQKDFKYARLLAAFYVRLIETPVNIYQSLEPLLSDHRRVVIEHESAIEIPQVLEPQSTARYSLVYADMVVDALLRNHELFAIPFPRLPPRPLLEETNQLQPRTSEISL